jgi:hypothetical protein
MPLNSIFGMSGCSRIFAVTFSRSDRNIREGIVKADKPSDGRNQSNEQLKHGKSCNDSSTVVHFHESLCSFASNISKSCTTPLRYACKCASMVSGVGTCISVVDSFVTVLPICSFFPHRGVKKSTFVFARCLS